MEALKFETNISVLNLDIENNQSAETWPLQILHTVPLENSAKPCKLKPIKILNDSTACTQKVNLISYYG